jgi:hypothetical protein
MKAKYPRRHLKESETPLLPGADQVAMCGEIVLHASFSFMYEDLLSLEFADFLSTLNVCRKCWLIERRIATERRISAKAELAEQAPSPRFVYGLATGQEQLDSERHYELVEAAA